MFDFSSVYIHLSVRQVLSRDFTPFIAQHQNCITPLYQSYTAFQMATDVDVMVQWDNDNTTNVVSLRDLKLPVGETLRIGLLVQMWWHPERRWYNGVVMDFGEPSPPSQSDKGSDDDIPLAQLIKKRVDEEDNGNSDNEGNISNDSDDIPLISLKKDNYKDITDKSASEDEIDSECDSFKDPLYTPDSDELNTDEELLSACVCENKGCTSEIFAACVFKECQRLLCYNHFDKDACDCQREHTNPSCEMQPEQYEVDGLPKLSPLKKRKVPEKVSIRKLSKKNRNSGKAYISLQSCKLMPARRKLKARCSSRCTDRGLRCDTISEDQRNKILNGFYDLENVEMQREWISRHIVVKDPKYGRLKGVSRKSKTLAYFLPTTDSRHIPVCRVMFLNTLNTTDRQIRTTLAKTSEDGSLQKEGRGGRRPKLMERDERLKISVTDHINRFPRMESHYCRQSTTKEYLFPDLTISKMHQLYNDEHPNNKVSISFYRKIFCSMNLKFHLPKKDLCGLCETFRNGEKDEREAVKNRYEKHIGEKEEVRRIKSAMKERAKVDGNFLAANFDLQQVLYLPISKRCELFYKRKLSCYNFTVYDLGSGEGTCYFWHEAIASRGANEIASCLHHFLLEADKKSVGEVVLFCDGCGGQNKNSILPAMFAYFIDHSVSVKCITLYFFETNHGQCEGDAMHSTIERAVKRSGDVFVPTQLAMIIRLARRVPYKVIEVQRQLLMDWKQYSQKLRILRIRESDEGVSMDWTKIKQLRIEKKHKNKLFYKMSHFDESFFTLSLHTSRQTTSVNETIKPGPILQQTKISTQKYNDLVSFCDGSTPVIFNPDHSLFYRNLPH